MSQQLPDTAMKVPHLVQSVATTAVVKKNQHTLTEITQHRRRCMCIEV